MKDRKERYTEKPIENVVEVVLEPKKKEVPFEEHKVRSTIPKLRIRVAPDSTAEAIDSISIGQSATIIAEKDGWGKLKFIDGWINLKYTERV
mgnify:CR=1 FL=1